MQTQNIYCSCHCQCHVHWWEPC